jgi:hypothetical protein
LVAIDRCGVDEVDAVLECGPDGSDGFGFVGTTPHPAADGPGANSDGRHPERGAWNFREIHVCFYGCCLIVHDSIPS